MRTIWSRWRRVTVRQAARFVIPQWMTKIGVSKAPVDRYFSPRHTTKVQYRPPCLRPILDPMQFCSAIAMSMSAGLLRTVAHAYRFDISDMSSPRGPISQS
ncbi:hypothetical protein [Paraburkholderia strydomiana]|uniref:hypothetical protein n=1 Tax=Paraburkholderia strydomiana TaxID=1245417 RepID=UPI0038BD7CFC